MIYVYYHRGDLDGIGSAALLYYFLNVYFPKTNGLDVGEQKYIGVEYGEKEHDFSHIKPDDVVWVVDFTFEPIEYMHKLNEISSALIWVDHHKSSILEVNKFPKGTFKGIMGDLNNSKSAIKLLWEYFFPYTTNIPEVINYISLFDTWKHEYKDEILNFYFGLETYSNMKYDSPIWQILFEQYLTEDNQNVTSYHINQIKEIGSKIRKYIQINDRKYAYEHCYEIQFEGLNTLIMNNGNPGSMKFADLYDPKKHQLILSYARKKGYWKISIYSDANGVDCSEIAKKYGGGGHKGAAGFEIHGLELPFEI